MEKLINDLDNKISKAQNITGNLFNDLEEIRNSFNNLKEAINYTHSCTELKDKEALTLKDAFIAGYKKRALMSDLKYDEVSELNAITNFKCWKSFDLDL